MRGWKSATTWKNNNLQMATFNTYGMQFDDSNTRKNTPRAIVDFLYTCTHYDFIRTHKKETYLKYQLTYEHKYLMMGVPEQHGNRHRL